MDFHAETFFSVFEYDSEHQILEHAARHVSGPHEKLIVNRTWYGLVFSHYALNICASPFASYIISMKSW